MSANNRLEHLALLVAERDESSRVATGEAKIDIQNLNFYHDGKNHTLKDINLSVMPKSVTAIMGPSGSGKSTLLRCLNRIYEIEKGRGHKITGRIILDGVNILSPKTDLNTLRTRIGMIFQIPTPFPMTVYENIAFGIKLYENLSSEEMDEKVKAALTKVGLWKQVANRLHNSAEELSGGQKQRLCIARTIAIQPEVILFDEPTSSLDRRSVFQIEQLIDELRRDYAIVLVTHDPQQAARVADFAAVLIDGKLIEYGPASQIFVSPETNEVSDFLTGRLGVHEDDDAELPVHNTPKILLKLGAAMLRTFGLG